MVRQLSTNLPGARPPGPRRDRQPARFPALDARGVLAPREPGEPGRAGPGHPHSPAHRPPLPQPPRNLIPAREAGAPTLSTARSVSSRRQSSTGATQAWPSIWRARTSRRGHISRTSSSWTSSSGATTLRSRGRRSSTGARRASSRWTSSSSTAADCCQSRSRRPRSPARAPPGGSRRSATSTRSLHRRAAAPQRHGDAMGLGSDSRCAVAPSHLSSTRSGTSTA